MIKKFIYERPTAILVSCTLLAAMTLSLSGYLIYTKFVDRNERIAQAKRHMQQVKQAQLALDAYYNDFDRSLNFDVGKFKSYRDKLYDVRFIGWSPKSLECDAGQCGLHYLPIKNEPTAIPQQVFFLDGDIKISLSNEVLSLGQAKVSKKIPVDAVKVIKQVPTCDDALINVNYLQYIANNGISAKLANYSSATPINKLKSQAAFIKNGDPLLQIYEVSWSISGLDESRFLFFSDWLYSNPSTGIRSANFVDNLYTFTGVQYCEVQ